jgi:hypothetical protein
LRGSCRLQMVQASAARACHLSGAPEAWHGPRRAGRRIPGLRSSFNTTRERIRPPLSNGRLQAVSPGNMLRSD